MDGENTQIIFSITTWQVVIWGIEGRSFFFSVEPACVVTRRLDVVFFSKASSISGLQLHRHSIYVFMWTKQKHIYKGIGGGIRC